MQVNEVYSAVQGEGPLNGTPSIFVRFHLCPVKCEWCDTAYTWDGSEKGESLDYDEIFRMVDSVASNPNNLVRLDDNHPDTERPRCVNHVVITGGEPMVQASLHLFMGSLRSAGYTVEVETACIFGPKKIWSDVSDSGVTWNLSPKMPSAKAKINPSPEILNAWHESPVKTEIKIVVDDSDDLSFAFDLLSKAKISLEDVMFMPCATSVSELGEKLRWLYPIALQRGFRVISRTHVTAYNGKRAT